MGSHNVSQYLMMSDNVMMSHGVSLHLMVTHNVWHLMMSHGVSWCLMVSADVLKCLLVSYSDSWCLMVSHSNLWWIRCLMMSHRVSWCLMMFHSVSQCLCITPTWDVSGLNCSTLGHNVSSGIKIYITSMRDVSEITLSLVVTICNSTHYSVGLTHTYPKQWEQFVSNSREF